MLPILLLSVSIPAVTLSEGHQGMTRVEVGQAFPEIAGLAAAQGEKATVIAVPGGVKWMNAMFTSDLKGDFAPKYAGRGVGFVTLTGPQLADRITALQIEQTRLNEALGVGRLPRVYVIDPTGKVVWFDVEYSLATHRDLHATLDEILGE